MTLILRRMRAQDRIEGREPVDTGEDDYAVVNETRIGRICREPIHGEMKWRWFLQAPLGNKVSGTATELPLSRADSLTSSFGLVGCLADFGCRWKFQHRRNRCGG